MEENKVDTAIVIPFTKSLSKNTAAAFVERVRQSIPFTHLVLGHDATLGRDRQGNRLVMNELGEMWGFHIHYIDEYRYEGTPTSSTQIRKFLFQGKIEEASLRLGRPYSIYSTVTPGLGKGKKMGYPTLNFNVKGLCLPPLGVYAVSVHSEGQQYQGIANLGRAPTVRDETSSPLLEVHLFDKELTSLSLMEVIFNTYIRPEKKFENVEDLKRQIAEDIIIVKNI